MTPDNDLPRPADPDKTTSRQWTKPTLVAYGPISKLTRGGSGAKKDGSVLVKA